MTDKECRNEFDQAGARRYKLDPAKAKREAARFFMEVLAQLQAQTQAQSE